MLPLKDIPAAKAQISSQHFLKMSVLFGFALLASGPLEAATLITSQDSFIQDGTSSNNNNGSVGSIQSSARGSNFNRKAYVGFNISGVLSSGQLFDLASFSVTTLSTPFNPGATSGSFSINIYGLTNATSWTETGITWNNAPQNNTGSATGLLSQTSLLGSIVINLSATGGVTYSLSNANVTAYLNWAAGKSGDFYGTGVTSLAAPTFIITDDASTPTTIPSVQFVSLQGSGIQPQISYTVVPEPKTFGLLLIGAIGSLAIMRKRQEEAATPLNADHE